jgi:hypothetical protein
LHDRQALSTNALLGIGHRFPLSLERAGEEQLV